MLTKNQLFELEYNFSKYDTAYKIASTLKNWGFSVEEKHITDPPSTFLRNFIQIQKRHYKQLVQTWQLQTRYTPTNRAEIIFNPVSNPTIGKIYHLSWAYKGAKFRLRKIEFPYAYMDNPKHKRDTLLKVNLSDLRDIRN